MDAAGVQQAGQQDAQGVIFLHIEIMIRGIVCQHLHANNLVCCQVELRFQHAVIKDSSLVGFIHRQ